jgi:N-acyl-D-aspartate/D-glutamate deacylase
MNMHQLVIRNGTVIDGTGGARRVADVAVNNGVITEVGKVTGRGHREIDAEGHLVAPGFVDIHTHYDGQASWDQHLAPSSWHGVTTAVMGNCGVGFAPAFAHNHDRLIELMEGVEDIPGIALHEGLPWAWQSFPDYLDFLETLPRDIDLGAQMPHAALRVHVMGARAVAREPATDAEIATMAQLTREAIEAGALGFTTSRTINHRSISGEAIPTLRAEARELLSIARAIGTTGRGVMQIVSDLVYRDHEFELIEQMARESGRPISISMAQGNQQPDLWRSLLERISGANTRGVQMRAQVAARAIGLLLGFDATLNPFMYSPAYQLIAKLPLAERVQRMREPTLRQTMIAEAHVDPNGLLGSRMLDQFQAMYRLGDPPDYEPDPSTSVAAVAHLAGRAPAEVALDWLLENDGHAMLYSPSLNYADGNLDAVRAMLVHPHSVPGLSDGGAHVGTICDVSFPTTLLQWWGRDRPHDRIPLEFLIARQSRGTALAVGLEDRGLIAPGYKADINVIDFEALRLHAPEMVHDLPAGGRRLLQRADGYKHTLVAGQEIMSAGEATGVLPGRLLRGGTRAVVR